MWQSWWPLQCAVRMKYSFQSCDVLHRVHANTAQEDRTNQWQASERAVKHDEGLWNSVRSSANANLGTRQTILGRHQPSPSSIQAESSMLNHQGGADLWMSSQHLLKSLWILSYWVLWVQSWHPEGSGEKNTFIFSDSLRAIPSFHIHVQILCQSHLQSTRQSDWAPGGFTFSCVEKYLSRHTSWTVTPHVSSVHQLEAPKDVA